MSTWIKRHSAKLTLDKLPKKVGRAWCVNIANQGEYWIPDTFVKEFDPVTRIIMVDTWILDQKGIKYKV